MLNFKALILAGGQSKRMGEDKALLKYYQKPQAFYLLEMLSKLNVPVYLSINNRQLPQFKNTPNIILDHWSQKGPLGGIASAFETDGNAHWLVLGCDYPKIRLFDLQHLIYQSSKTEKSVAYFHENYFLPTVAIYKNTDAQTLVNAAKNNKLKMQNILKDIECLAISPLNNDRFVSVNTVEMYQKVYKEINP